MFGMVPATTFSQPKAPSTQRIPIVAGPRSIGKAKFGLCCW